MLLLLENTISSSSSSSSSVAEAQKPLLLPSQADLVNLLHACKTTRDRASASHLHVSICSNGLDLHPLFANQFVLTFSRLGSPSLAQRVFERSFPQPIDDNINATWNALLTSYVNHGQPKKALHLYRQSSIQTQSDLLQNNLFLLPCVFSCLLKACGEMKDIETGYELHVDIAEKGLLENENHLFVGNALISMYAKCGYLGRAHQVFDDLRVRNVVSWNTLIAGYVSHGHGKEALMYFEEMKHKDEGVYPNPVSFLCALKACGIVRGIEQCEEIHAEISRQGLLRTNVQLGSTLLDVYAKLGFLEKAQDVFEMLPVKDVVSWTSLIGGYADHGYGEEALNFLEEMKYTGILPNAATFVCSLKACGAIGSSSKGQEIHLEVCRQKLLSKNIRVGNALVDMYAKCGLLSEAQKVFNKIPDRNIITWTSLIAGYAQIRETSDVCIILKEMIEFGVFPNLVTFLVLLSACSHRGLVRKGQACFKLMCRDYGIIPTIEHYNCMVDLLGRAGQLAEAVEMIEKMPLNPDLRLWHTLLGACRMLGNVEISEQAFQHAVKLDETDDSAYICMYNIYADAGMQENAEKVEALRIQKEAWCKSGIGHPLLATD